MAVLTVQNLSVSFGERVLFSDVSFDVETRDKIGFIGANGVGKTTLFKVISGEINPTEGDVVRNKELKIGYMQQHACNNPKRSVYFELLSVFEHLQDMEKEIESVSQLLENQQGDLNKLIEKQLSLNEKYENEGGLTYKSRTRSALSGLGFNEDDMQMEVCKLSGGQLSKLSLAKLLLGGANFLLLDEPTNHLDIASVEWLESFIKDFKGAIIVISHDRYFLDAVTNKTIEVEHNKMMSYIGNYSAFIKKKEEYNESLKNKYENDLKEIKRIEGIIAQQKKFGQAHNYITIASKQKQLDRVKDNIETPDSEVETLSFSLSPNRESGNDVLICKELEKSFGEKKLFSNVDLHITKGEKVFLLGSNGCGKTTLFKTILGLYKTSGSVQLGANVDIGYFDQVQADLTLEKTALDEVWDEFPQMSQTKIRTALGAFMFSGDDVFKKIKYLSGGERARVALLKLMLNGANFLLLDEPTNHLDTASREALEKTLSEYGGTMFVISHDRYFINKLSDKIVTLTADKAEVCLGDYDRYAQRVKNIKTSEIVEQKKEKRNNNDYFAKKELQSNIRKAKTKIERIEKDIEKTEQEIERLETELTQESVLTDFERLTELTNELEKVKITSEELLENWSISQEELENLEKTVIEQ